MKILFHQLFILMSLTGGTLFAQKNWVDIQKQCANKTSLTINEKNIKTLDFKNITDIQPITKIEVKYCKITNEQFKNLIEALGATQVISLHLAGINITKEMWATISNNAQKIKLLDLTYLQDPKINNWEYFIKNEAYLKKLRIYDYTSQNYSISNLFKAFAHSKNKIDLSLFFSQHRSNNWNEVLNEIEKNSITNINNLSIDDKNLTTEEAIALLQKFNCKKLQKLHLYIDKNHNPLETIKEKKDLAKKLEDLVELCINKTMAHYNNSEVRTALNLPPKPIPPYPLTWNQKINYEAGARLFIKKFTDKIPGMLPPKILIEINKKSAYTSFPQPTIYIDPKACTNIDLFEGILLHELKHAIDYYYLTSRTDIKKFIGTYILVFINKNYEYEADYFSINNCSSKQVLLSQSKMHSQQINTQQHIYQNKTLSKNTSLNNKITARKKALRYFFDEHPSAKNRAQYFAKAAKNMQNKQSQSSLRKYIEEFEQ